MSFIDWWECNCGEKWHEDYALSNYASGWLEQYKIYCSEKNIKPIWNG